jgi:shikimate kinase
MRKTVKQIFDEQGEEKFRKIEHNMLHEVAEFENVVISCGGGTPCFYDNMDYLNQQGDTIYLKASPDVLYKHLKIAKGVRPLLLNKTPEEVQVYIREELSRREQFYGKAKHILNIDVMDSLDKVQHCIEEIKKTVF